MAVSINDVVNKAINDNTDLSIERLKLENNKNQNYRIYADFLPNIYVNLISGERRNKSNQGDISTQNNNKLLLFLGASLFIHFKITFVALVLHK